MYSLYYYCDLRSKYMPYFPEVQPYLTASRERREKKEWTASRRTDEDEDEPTRCAVCKGRGIPRTRAPVHLDVHGPYGQSFAEGGGTLSMCAHVPFSYERTS